MPRNENARRCPEPRPHPCGCGAPRGVARQHQIACLQVCEKTFCFGNNREFGGLLLAHARGSEGAFRATDRAG